MFSLSSLSTSLAVILMAVLTSSLTSTNAAPLPFTTNDPLWATYGYNSNWCLGNPSCSSNDVYWAVRGGTPNAWSDWCTGNSNCDGINDWCIGNSNCWAGYNAWCVGNSNCVPGAYTGQWFNVQQQQLQQQIATMNAQITATTDAATQQAMQQQMQAVINQQAAASGVRWY